MNLKPTFEHYYPDNFKGGECGVFAHKLVKFPPVGNTLASKTLAVKKYGILAPTQFLAGDVVITSEALATGHVFVVNDIIGDSLQCTESNYKLDGKVYHTRLIKKNSLKIVGVIRGPLLVQIINMPTYPITIKVKVIINSPTTWGSINNKLSEIKNWYTQYSQNKIDLQFVYEFRDLGEIPFKYNIDETAVIDYDWFDANVLDSNFHTTVLVVTNLPSNWPNGYRLVGRTFGYQGKFPTKTVINCTENEPSPSYPQVNNFVDLLRHEVMHSCYIFSGTPEPPPFGSGLDWTHKYFFLPSWPPPNNGLGSPEAAFSELTYENIFNTLKKQPTMLAFKFGNTIYVNVFKKWVPIADSDTFLELGGDWNYVKTLTQSEFTSIIQPFMATQTILK